VNDAKKFIPRDTEIVACQYMLARLLLMPCFFLQYKPTSCDVQAHKGDRVRVHYRVSNFSSLCREAGRMVQFSETFLSKMFVEREKAHSLC